MRVYGGRWKPFASHSRYGRVDWRLVAIEGRVSWNAMWDGCGSFADNSKWFKTP